MRGEHDRFPRHAERLVRFIPACAGNTGRMQRAGDDRSVHPRMRGEHLARLTPDNYDDGSSPHARGTPAYDEFP